MGKCCYEAASLKHRVTLQSLARVSDGQGGYSESWTDVSDVWVSIAPMKGYERFQAMQMQTPVTHKIVMRYRSDVTTAHRLLYGSRVFALKEVLNRDEDSRFLDIKALEQQ